MTQQIGLSIFTDFPYQSIKITRLLSIFIDTDFYRLSTPGCKQKSLVYISVSYMTWTHYRVLDHYWDVSQITNLSAKNNKLKVRWKYRQTCPGEWFPKTACSITAVFPTQLPPTTTSRKYFGISHKLLKSPTKNCQSACNFTDLYHQPRQIRQNFNNGCPAELRLQVDWDDWRTTRSGGGERENSGNEETKTGRICVSSGFPWANHWTHFTFFSVLVTSCKVWSNTVVLVQKF